MTAPATPPDEAARLDALRGLRILDTPPEARFDRLTKLTQTAFDAPVALISLIDVDRQWFKSCQGVTLDQTPRALSFCGHAILSPEVMVVPDAALDPRFADNPFVTGPTRVRFYAGAPLRLSGGAAVGTLCVLDTRPRDFGARERSLLSQLAGCVVSELTDARIAVAHATLDAVFEGTTDAVYVKDAHLRYVLVNSSLCARLGRPREDVVGRRLSELLPGPDSSAIEEGERRVMAAKSVETVSNEIEARGRRRAYLSTKGAIVDGRDVTGLFGISREITELREHERLKDELVHHVNHELRTPLAAALMALEMLKQSGEGINETQQRLLGHALDSARHLERMTQDLLDTTRADTGKLRVEPRPGDAAIALRSLIESLKPLAAKRGIFLGLAYPDSALGRFDPVRLRQVVGNLVDNALKFTPRGGRVMVLLECPEGAIHVSVVDDGPGMEKADLDRVFDRLYQTKTKAEHGATGLGLGLHICREIVSAHGGRIWVESQPGRGSAFHFTLPA